MFGLYPKELNYATFNMPSQLSVYLVNLSNAYVLVILLDTPVF